MKRFFIPILVAVFVFVTITPATVSAEGGYVVQAGDTLAAIARRYGVSISRLAQANGLQWNDWVYTGQRLVIPGQATAPTASTGNSTYIVRPGDTLYSIALNHGLSMAALKAANGITNANLIYSGQKLIIPGGGGTVKARGEKWIDVNLSTQTITAYVGQTPIKTAVVSTGVWQTPTVVGTFKIYVKHRLAYMAGGSGADAYALPNVPHVMYFYKGYGFHGTYWHSNFGTPMSHGCVNLSRTDAAWLYEWAPIGTKVVSHY